MISAIYETVPKYRTSEIKRAPWSNRIIRKWAKKKRQFWDKYRQSKNPADYEKYKETLNRFNAEKSKAVERYENNIIANKKTNQKAYYNYVSHKNKYGDNNIQLSKNNETTSDPKECSEILMDFYESVGSKGPSPLPRLLPQRTDSSMPELEISETKIKEILSSLDTSKATGSDDIAAFVLREHCGLFAKLLHPIFTRTYAEGKIPKAMKLANVVPIYKKGDRKSASNYRPVSLNPIIAKVLELIMIEPLEKYIEENQLLNEAQHGFRKGKSTATGLLEFWNKVTDITDKGSDVSIIYTDFQKAFDSVPRDLLLLKLDRLGIRDKNLRWYENYLHDRTQRVVIKDQMSRTAPSESGVPQGSVLSGILFSLYINDLTNCLNYCYIALYADDAKIFAPVHDPTSIQMIQADLDRIYSWCKEWRLNLNIDKCFFLHCGMKMKNQNIEVKYILNQTALKREKQALDLGIIISEDMKWHHQVTRATNKAKAQIHIFRRTFKSRNFNFIRNMFKMHVAPHLEYCVEVWNPQHKGDIEKMEKCQNLMTRQMNFGKVLSPTKRNEYLKLPTHEDRRLRGDLINTFKRINNPDMFEIQTEPRRNHNSRNIKIQYSRTDIKKHSFFRRTATQWNQLPSSVVEANNVQDFKKKLDKHMKWP